MDKRFTVVFEPDEGDFWAVSIPSVKGVRTQAKSLEQGRKRIREALSLAIGDDAADAAELVDDVRIPKGARAVVDGYVRVSRELKRAQELAHKKQMQAAMTLSRAGFTLRDSASILGLSHQRVQQILESSERATK